jgi:hypothetical protein
LLCGGNCLAYSRFSRIMETMPTFKELLLFSRWSALRKRSSARSRSIPLLRVKKASLSDETATYKVEHMAVKRLDNVGIVVDDLEVTIDFFRELGLELEGRATIEGEWAGRVTGLRNQRVEIAMMRTPDGHSRLELSRFLTPLTVGSPQFSGERSGLPSRHVCGA